MRVLLPLVAQRKTALVPLLLTVPIICLTISVTFVASETNWEKARAARQQALAKQRRLMFNDDGEELDREDGYTPEGFLKLRLAPLAGTHVDTICYSVLEANAPMYDSKVQPIFGDAHGKPPQYWANVAPNIKRLIKTGHCPLQIIIDFAHKNGMEVFGSVRMNDCHDSFIAGWLPLWKKEHPEFLVDRGDVPHDMVHPLGLYVTALDFAHKEVRDHKFEIIEEVCQRYDVAGIDLNFMRHPVFFSRTMRGEPVTDEEVEIMTSLLRRIRRLTDERGLERGRPILVAAIVPDSLQLSRNIGLDVETWIKEDLIDIVTPGLGYAPFSLPVEEYIELAHQHGKKVYPCINRVAPWHVPEGLISEGFGGVAANWYAAGADGIFFWNLGTPFGKTLGVDGDDLVKIRSRYYAALPELGEPETLGRKDKLFCLDDPVLKYYQHVSSRPPLPLALKPDEREQVTFAVADDLQAAAQDGSLRKATLMMEFTGLTEQDNLVLCLNGQDLTECQADSENGGPLRISCALEASQVKQGRNGVEATLKKSRPDGDEAIRLSKVRLLVRYKR